MRFEKRLLQLIKQNEIIFNPKLPEFKIKKLRMEAWESIAMELHSDVLTCRKRWRALRNTYRKIKSKNSSVLSDTEGCTSKWCYLDDMAFVDGCEVLASISDRNKLCATQQQMLEETKGQELVTDLSDESDPGVDAILKNNSSIIFEDSLVQEVQKYKLLWDKTHPDHRNNYQKSFIWKIIAKNLKTTPKICLNIWLSIQSRYRRKKMTAYEKDGKTFYNFRWKYWGKISFMNQYKKLVRSSNEANNWEENEAQIKEKMKSSTLCKKIIKPMNTSFQNRSCEQELLNSKKCTAKRKKQRRLAEKAYYCHKSQSQLMKGNNFKSSGSTTTTLPVVDTSCSNYLHTLGTKIDNIKIPLHVKYNLERRVGNLVYDVLAQITADEN